MTPCTLWYRRDPLHEWEFNHLSGGHETGKRPAPKTPDHVRAWRHGEWERKHVWLTDDKPPRVQFCRDVA